MVRLVGAFVVAVAVMAMQPQIPAALTAMADTERAFAERATVVGWRDAFLEYFADDAIAFSPGVVPAKDGLRKQPSTPFSIAQLVWEPRTGDVAASGDLGWLTGPSTSINRKAAEPAARHGCYLSIWRKQPDGRWRVFIDVGTDAPEAVTFVAGFTRTTIASPYTGNDGKAAAARSLAAADRDLNLEIAAKGFAPAFAARLASASRLHRPGSTPQTGRDAIVQWLAANAATGTATDVGAESASSGDLGYTHGRFDIKDPRPATGVYIRLWNRDASGTWWLTVDAAQLFK